MGIYDDLTEVSCEILHRVRPDQGYGSRRAIDWTDTYADKNFSIEAKISAPLVVARFISEIELCIDTQDVGMSQLRYEPSHMLPTEDQFARYIFEQFALYTEEVLHAG